MIKRLMDRLGVRLIRSRPIDFLFFLFLFFFLISIDLMFDTPTDVVSESFYVAQCIISDHRL